MNLFAVKTAARGLTFRRWATTLEISNAVERKPNHLSGGGPTGCHGRSAENPITVPKTDVAGTGQSQQTVASPRVIRYSLLRDFMDSTKRSEEHTSELQSRLHLVCRLLLEKKKITHERKTSQRVKVILETRSGCSTQMVKPERGSSYSRCTVLRQ